MKTPSLVDPRRFRLGLLIALLLATSASFAQDPDVAGGAPAPEAAPPPPPPPPPPPGPPPPGGYGAPLPGLTAGEVNAFSAGVGQFLFKETVATGLGPIFNGDSCAACHTQAALGGSSNVVTTRFGRVVNGQFDPLTNLGGSLLQDKAIAPMCREFIPSTANVIAHRQTMALFGDGLIEAIPDATIEQNAKIEQQQGLHGVCAMITDITTGKLRAGRFGWKAQQATLLAFAADAFVNEMGITNRFFPTENAPNGNQVLLAKCDHVPSPQDPVDPATGLSGIDRAANFMRLLGPPPAHPNKSTQAGAALFDSTGCSGCHTPSMRTGANAIAALNKKPVFLYSDLLLHDMGSLNDGIVQAAATGQQMKTPALWGVSRSGPWLHDGRAATIDQAIRLHDGDAKASRNHYLNLQEGQRQQILAFLNTI